ncbi:MAG: ArnT family glycosyltransferase, partial [Pseudomonas sp.]
FMLILHIATIGLLFALARRLQIGSLAAGLGVLAFALSPLVVEFSRYVLLDNVALPWLLGAFILALSPRRSLAAAIGSATCMAIAILSKETFAVLLPVLLYALWRNGDARNRRYVLTAFGVVFLMISAAYILYAALKNELLPGDGHVSLIGTLLWQLFGREGSGSIFDAASGTRGLVSYWLQIDYWLLAAGTVALIPALIYRNLRPAGLALLISLALLLRSGYLPYPYVIIILPFAALALAGTIDRLMIRPLMRGKTTARLGAGALILTILLTAVIFVAPAWQAKLTALTSIDQDQSSRQAVAWIDANIARDSRLVVESALWTDLQVSGFSQPDPVWLYKTETDPEVTRELAGWQGIDYIVLNGPTIGARGFAQAFPTVSEAIQNGTVIQEFGSDNQKILVYKISK